VTDLLLTNCAVVDVRAGTRTADAAVAISGGVIAACGKADDVVPAARRPDRVIDLGGASLIPGLINCHVHFGLVLPGSEGAALRGESEAALALRMAANAAKTLRAGVTTVRLVGERPYTDIALRASIAHGETVGPRIVTAGPLLVATGGHGWELPGCVEADGADGFQRAAREQIKHGVDWIKISISGGIAGEREAIADAQMTAAEIAAAVGAAHARGKKVAAHAGPAEVVTGAVELGVDSIEHGYFLDDATCALMAERGTWLVPTVNVSRAVDFYAKIGAPRWMVERALAAGEIHFGALSSAIRHGVRIALGTDMMPHEPFDGTTVTVRELEFMVEAAMSPAEALRAATLHAAELLDLDDTIGAVEVGKAADLVAVDGDPLIDIGALRHIRAVFAGGRLVEDE
jgi:imidazolonepropionase-like amidohydrolase